MARCRRKQALADWLARCKGRLTRRVHREEIAAADLIDLRAGLSALAEHFGMTGRATSGDIRFDNESFSRNWGGNLTHEHLSVGLLRHADPRSRRNALLDRYMAGGGRAEQATGGLGSRGRCTIY